MKLPSNFKKYASTVIAVIAIVGFGIGVLAQTGSMVRPFINNDGLQTKHGQLVVMDLPDSVASLATLVNPATSFMNVIPNLKLFVDQGISTFSNVDSVAKTYVLGCQDPYDGRVRFGAASVDNSACVSVQGNILATDLTSIGDTTNRALCADSSGRVVVCGGSTVTYQWNVSSWGECQTSTTSSCTGTYTQTVYPDSTYASCFVAGTQVLMADGTTKNIQEVAIGDVLKGATSDNVVLGFHRPLLGDKVLYSFNGSDYFVTAEHPFMTTDGWKAFDPELAMQEHHLDIEVKQLAIGDTLVTENGTVLLTSVDTKSAEGTTKLYNFALSGDHTYYADGYLVHNKWTSCTVTDGVQVGCSAGTFCIDHYTQVIPYNGSGECTFPCTYGEPTTGNPTYCLDGYKTAGFYCDWEDDLHCIADGDVPPYTETFSCSSLTRVFDCISTEGCTWGTSGGYQTRSVSCLNSLGQTVDSALCVDAGLSISGTLLPDSNGDSIPDTTQSCTPDGYSWRCDGSTWKTYPPLTTQEACSPVNYDPNLNYTENMVVCSSVTPDDNDCSTSSSTTVVNAVCGNTSSYVVSPSCSVGIYAGDYDDHCSGAGIWYGTWTCLGSGGGDSTECVTEEPNCFTTNTKVTMSNGTTKNIQDVKIGDWVIGADGVASPVLGIHKPVLGERRDRNLYAFNGGRTFVTAEHPFMTTDGWKAIDPLWSMEEHNMTKVSQLGVGDTLITEEGPVLITSIEVSVGDPDTQLYNLMLGGNHTYYADGYLVHNEKCPDTEPLPY